MSKTYYTGFYPPEGSIGTKGTAAFATYSTQLSIYKRSELIPTTPTGGTYNFAGSVFTPPAGWTVEVPEGLETAWVSSVQLVTYDPRELVNPIEGWSVPVAAFQTGVSPVNVVLTNPTVNVPADIDGGSLILTNTGTDIYAYQGTDELVFDQSLSTIGSWTVEKLNSAEIVGGTVSDRGSFARFSNITGMSGDTGSIAYTITVRVSESQTAVYSAQQTFKKMRGAVIDTAPPAVPTGLTLTSSVVTLDGGNTLGKLAVTWVANTESDFSYYEVEIREGSGSYIGYQTGTNSYEWTVKTNTLYSVRVRSVDRWTNRSAWSTVSTNTTVKDSTVPSVPTSLTATAAIRTVFLSWTNSSATDIQSVEVWENTANNSSTATKIATVNAEANQKGGFTRSGVVTGTTYHYWLKSVDSSGNTSGFSTGTSVTPVAVANSDITANTVNADRIQAGTITGDRFNTGTSLPGTITVGATGVSIGTVQTQAANPSSTINAGTTLIDPGKIQITGTTTLASWKNGPDSTQINGGSIAANTITANKLYIGLRGVDMAGLQFQANWNGTSITNNVVSWSAGSLIYTDDSGVITTVNITANNNTWSSGILYIYWVKGETILRTTTSSATAYGVNNIVLATYRGGTDLIVNYGRTIIDGSQITTGTVTADRVRTDSVIANRFYVGGNRLFIHGSYYGDNLGSIVVNDGTRDRVTLGYTSASTIGLKIVDASGSTILDSSTTASQILNSSVTYSGLSDKPTSLSGINSTEGTKLSGIQAGATVGAVIGTNLTGTFTEAEFNNRFTTGIIGGTYLKNASIDTAQIKDLAVKAAKIDDLAVTNAKINNLAVDTIKIAGNAVTIPLVYTGSDLTLTSTTTESTAIEMPSAITVGDATGGGALLVYYAIFDSRLNTDSAHTIFLYVDTGSGYTLRKHTIVGAPTNNGSTYPEIPVAIPFSVSGTSTFRAKITARLYNTSTEGSWTGYVANLSYHRSPTLVVLGVKR